MTQSTLKTIEFAAYIGIDWADQKHDISLQETNSSKIETYRVNQRPEELIDWVSSLQKRFGGRSVAVAIEQKRGALIYALMQYDFMVIYPINPKSLAKYREAFATSGAKDDPTDARYIREMVYLHRDQLRPWIPDTVQTREIALMVEHRRNLVNDQTRITNRLTAYLKLYFPQALDWVGDLAMLRAVDFLTRWPDLSSIQSTDPEEIKTFYKKKRYSLREKLDGRLQDIKQACPITSDKAVIKTSRMMIQVHLNILKSTLEAISEFDKQIESSFNQHPDHHIFSSLPGAGPVFAPRLLAAVGSDRQRYDSAEDLQSFSGIAPITIRSGRMKTVRRRLACPKFVRQSFHEFAAYSILSSDWALTYYRKQRGKGNKHHAAVRSLAYKWIRIIFKCWKENQPYDAARYSAAIQLRSSTLKKAA